MSSRAQAPERRTRRGWLMQQGRCLLGLGSAALALPSVAPTAALDAPGGTAGASPALGERVRWPAFRQLDGRPVEPPQPGQEASVVVFFLTTCPFCARHNEHVQKLVERTRGLPLRVLGVAQDDEAALVKTYLARKRLTFQVSMEHRPLRAALSTLRGVPLTCVVDRQQRLREVIRGEMFEEDVLDLARWATA